MRFLRPLLLVIALCGLGWFQFGQPLTARALVRRTENVFDRRPSRTVLILGNSRTYYHDMPDMIRAMADSAHDPEKLEITLDAPAGASFEILWKDGAPKTCCDNAGTTFCCKAKAAVSPPMRLNAASRPSVRRSSKRLTPRTESRVSS